MCARLGTPWWSEDNLEDSVLSFQQGVPGDGTQTVRLGGLTS